MGQTVPSWGRCACANVRHEAMTGDKGDHGGALLPGAQPGRDTLYGFHTDVCRSPGSNGPLPKKGKAERAVPMSSSYSVSG